MCLSIFNVSYSYLMFLTPIVRVLLLRFYSLIKTLKFTLMVV